MGTKKVDVEGTSAEGRNVKGKNRKKRKRDIDVEAASVEVVAPHAEGGNEEGGSRKKRKRVKDGDPVDSITGTDGKKVRCEADSLNEMETDNSNKRKKMKKKKKHRSVHEQPPLQEGVNEKLSGVGDDKADDRNVGFEKSVEEGAETENSEHSDDRKKEKKKKKKHSIDEEPVVQKVTVGDNQASRKDSRHAMDSIDEIVNENSEDPNDRKKEKKKKKQRIEQETVSQEAPVGNTEANTKEVDKATTESSEFLGDRKKKEKKKKKQRIDEEPVSPEAPVGNNEASTKEVDKATTQNSKHSEQRKKEKKKKKKKKKKNHNIDQEQPARTKSGKSLGKRIEKKVDKATSQNSEHSEERKNKKKKKNQSIDQEQPARTKSGKSLGKRIEKDASDSSSPKSTSKRVSFSEDVQVFPISNDDESTGEDKKVIRGTRFSPEEDQLVKASVLEYINTHALGDAGLDMVLHCKKHKEVSGCWKEIGLALPWRPYQAVYSRAHVIFERDANRKWTAEECELVMNFHKKHGADWKTLAGAIGKHRSHVKDVFRRLDVKNKKSGKWSQEEYQTLFDLVNADLRMKAFAEVKKSKYGMLRDNISWSSISSKLETRSNALCSMKWYNQLSSPMVEEKQWLDTDDYQLVSELYKLDACCMEDVDWDDLLEHRSGEFCRRRWNQMVKHLGDTSNKSFAELVEILSNRYSFDVLEAREAYNNKPLVN